MSPQCYYYSGMGLKKFFEIPTSKKAFLIIVSIGLLVFFNSLFNGFIGDDEGQILRNISVHSLSNIPKFFSGSTFFSSETQKLSGVYYKPILNTVFSIIYSFFGPSASIFHFFQISLHILNAFLLFLFFKHFLKQSLALILSLIFLIHPINSEAVFYISNMQEPLFFFFGILALYLLSKTRSNKDLILVGFLLFFSLLSKETGALFFIVSIMFAFFSNKKYFLPLLGIEVLLLFLYFLLRINAVGIYANPFNAPIAKIDLPNRLLNIPAMIFFYLKTFVFPLKLSASYHWIVKQANFDLFFLPLTAILLFTALFVYFAYIIFKKHKESYFVPYLFFGTWFILGLFFHLQIIPLDATVAERWFYFPLVGLLGMAGLFSEIFLSRTKGEWVLMVSLFLIFLLSIRTFIRSFDWRDNLRLATQDIKVSPESYALENLMAQGLIVQNRLEEAKVHVERSVKFYPYSTNYINLGYIYFSMGDYPKAKEAYLKALEFGDYYLTYEGLAAVSVLYGDPRESIEFVKSALKKFPQSARLWLDLALLNYKVGNISEAKILARKAYSLSQDAATVSFYREIVNETLDFNSK